MPGWSRPGSNLRRAPAIRPVRTRLFAMVHGPVHGRSRGIPCRTGYVPRRPAGEVWCPMVYAISTLSGLIEQPSTGS
jgi:hypothetical protein